MVPSALAKLIQTFQLSPAEAEVLLEQFASEARARLAQGRPVDLPGAGRLVPTPEGVQFEAGEALAARLNAPYAALPAFALAGNAAATFWTHVTAEPPGAAPAFDEAPAALPPEDEAPGTEAPPPYLDAAQAPAPLAEAPLAEVPAEAPATVPPRPDRPARAASRRGSALPWVVGLLLLVGAVAVGALVLDRADAPPTVAGAPPLAADTTAPPDTTAAALPADTLATTQVTPPSEPSPATPSEAPGADTPPAPEPASAAFAPTAEQVGKYALIVGSSPSRDGAERLAARFRDGLAGVPVAVVAGTSGGVTRYRVAVGAFDSSDEAVRQKSQLSGLPEDAWVYRITARQ